MGGMLSGPILTKFVERAGNDVVRAASSSAQGYRVEMEDAHIMGFDINDNNKNTMCFGVFDGHGGPKASMYLQKNLAERLKKMSNVFDDTEMVSTLMKLDEDFLKTEDHNDGTTACFALLQPGAEGTVTVKVANVGDSRAMLIHPDGKFTELSEDHKPNNDQERARIINARGHVSDNRVNGNLAVSRAFGDSIYKGESYLAASKQLVIAVPDFKTAVAKPGDLLLVCCDGLYEQLSWTRVAAIVKEKMDVEAKSAGNESKVDLAVVANHLIDQSVRAGSRDNHTAVLVQIADGKDYTSAFSAKEVYPGPYHVYANDNDFVQAYKNDLKANGYAFDEVLPKIKAFEEASDNPPPAPETFAPSAEFAAMIQSLRSPSQV